MNFFELFEQPVRLQVDAAEISRKYRELSRRFHPDFFTRAGADAQQEALEKSALLHQALAVFRDPDETIRYVLQLKGLLQEGEKYELPPDFLMEVMEINEALMDADDPATSEVVKGKLASLQAEIEEPVADTLRQYTEGSTSVSALLDVKDYYFKKKYLDRLREQLSGMA